MRLRGNQTHVAPARPPPPPRNGCTAGALRPRPDPTAGTPSETVRFPEGYQKKKPSAVAGEGFFLFRGLVWSRGRKLKKVIVGISPARSRGSRGSHGPAIGGPCASSEGGQ